ncbi:hypothetical protein RHMOL_Rhmol04G0235800 [Rhododendron molle]|uniref:Uncharacterized protein n=1 Tax=Rhododendron molle TaxID=49168 RepID=A0ACC0P4W2_RHOML|nr:hypothetical protein RHMOL_Rhmol04G0235800 [Rhododendron molle]
MLASTNSLLLAALIAIAATMASAPVLVTISHGSLSSTAIGSPRPPVDLPLRPRHHCRFLPPWMFRLYNSQLKMTTRELESTKMEAKESFADFIKRSRAKAALMTDRPSETDQLCIISRNLQPDYAKHLVLVQAFANFETFFELGLAIEDALQSGILSKGESSNPPKS